MRHSTFRKNFVLITLLSLILTSLFSAALLSQDKTKQVQAYLEQVRLRGNMPGISAAVSVGGEIVFSGGVGYADIENNVPATGKTVHRIASISKPIGAIGLMQLHEQGKVNLDDDIRTFMPYFPEKRYPVLVQHILTHTSGVRHYNPGEFGKMDHYMTLEDATEIFRSDTLLFEPGTDFKYSTYGFNLVQGVIEEASGMKIGPYMKEKVWEPAGMLSTNFEVPGDIIYNRARGYTITRRGQLRNVKYTDVSIKYIGGGMISTVEDLLRLVHALDRNTLMQESTKELMYQHHYKHAENRFQGLSWGVRIEENGRRRISHSGGATGFSSMLIFYPAEKIAVALITNNDWIGVGNAAQSIADLYLSDIPLKIK